MAAPLSKKTLEHLAELARLELDGRSEGKLLSDFGRILDHFAELGELATDGVAPVAGGTGLVNALREDGEILDDDLGKGKEGFPEEKDGFLKVPKVL